MIKDVSKQFQNAKKGAEVQKTLNLSKNLENKFFSKNESVPCKFWTTIWKSKPCIGVMLLQDLDFERPEGSDLSKDLKDLMKISETKVETLIKKFKMYISMYFQGRKHNANEIIMNIKNLMPSFFKIEALLWNTKHSLEIIEKKSISKSFDSKNVILDIFEDFSASTRNKNVELIVQFGRDYPAAINCRIKEFKSFLKTLLLLLDEFLSHAHIRFIANSEEMEDGRLLSFNFYVKMKTPSQTAPPIDLLDMSVTNLSEIVMDKKTEYYLKLLNYYFILFGIRRETYTGKQQIRTEIDEEVFEKNKKEIFVE